MAVAQIQSTASEEDVRAAIAAALTAQGGTPTANGPGSLVVETGSVGRAYLAGPFRDKMKMPMLISVATAGGEGGTGISVEVTGRGTGSGFASGGLIGVTKQKRAEQAWLEIVTSAVPGRVGGYRPLQSG